MHYLEDQPRYHKYVFRITNIYELFRPFEKKQPQLGDLLSKNGERFPTLDVLRILSWQLTKKNPSLEHICLLVPKLILV